MEVANINRFDVLLYCLLAGGFFSCLCLCLVNVIVRNQQWKKQKIALISLVGVNVKMK